MKALLSMAAMGLAVCTLLAGCSQSASVETVEGTWIRVQNDSGIDFDQVIISFPAQREDYGAVAAGTESPYRKIPIAYRYASLEVHASGQRYDLQAFDYVGETPLGNGRFTYALSVEDNHVVLKFIEQ